MIKAAQDGSRGCQGYVVNTLATNRQGCKQHTLAHH